MPHSFSHSLIRWRITLQIVAVFALLIGVNYVAFRHYRHFDFSRSHRFSLSDQGSVLFAGIKQPAHIIIYFSPTSLAEGSELYGDVEALMQEYQIKARENLVVEYLDPARNLGRAREVQRKYQFDPNENVIVIDYLKQSTVIPVKELGEYTTPAPSTHEKGRLMAFRGEQVINAALIGLSGVPLKKIYFLQGHGEMVPGVSPLEIVGRYLKRQHVALASINLTATPELPSDASLIVIAGARSDLSTTEQNLLENYWKESGRLLVLLDPTASTPLLYTLLQTAGITPRLDRVVRTLFQGDNTTVLRDVTGEFIGKSELTKPLLGLNIPFRGTTQSLALAPSTDTLQLRPLVQALKGFWGATDFDKAPEEAIPFLESDTSYPVIIAAMADHGALHDDRVAVKAARMVVVGNSDFIQDKNLTDVDLDFFSSALNELIDRVHLTGNTAKMKAYYTLNLSEEEMIRIAIWSVLIIPMITALVGTVLLWRRKV